MSLFYIVDEVAGAGDGDVLVLLAGGELDYAAAPQLRERLGGHSDAAGRRVMLDLSLVTFIDSTAIGVIVAAGTGLQESGGSLAIVCAEENTRVLRIFDIAGVSNLLDVYFSREEAFSAIATAG